MYQYNNRRSIEILRKSAVLVFDVLFIAALIFLTALAAKAQSTNSDLIITVKTDKTEYAYNDPVNVTLEAENLTGVDKVLSFSTGCQMSFDLKQYLEETQAYTLPVYNDEIFARNCSATPTSITVPNGKKAIWTRTLDPKDNNSPDILPGKYLLHGYITDYDGETWSFVNSSYVNFTVDYAVSGDGVMCSETVLCGTGLTCSYSGMFADDGSGLCITSSQVLLNFPEQQLCEGTGGTFNLSNKTCACDSDYSWSEKVGCTKSVFLDELCVETGGITTGLEDSECFCGDTKQWDILNGCEEIKVIEFNDIADHWAEEFIKSLAKKGVVSGYEDGGFHPNANINRAELVKMALSSAGIPSLNPNGDSEFTFADVSGWQSDWVYAAWKKGIVQGYSADTFAPGQNVTRAEALKIAMLAFNVNVPDTSSEWAFSDTIGHWALSYINQAYLDFIISGREDNKFYPNDFITRAEAAKIIQLLSEK